jgi:glycosyltransferase involved in cell wall biosynthesis
MKLATRTLAALVDGVLVLSTEEERQWQSFVPSLRVRTVKNPYVRARPVGDAGAGGPPRALFVGRLHREKGIFELADALPRVLEETPFELVLVGEGPAETELRERLRQLRVEERVTFAGYREGDALRREYECATVFVLPSWSEGFPTVLAEAMDAGVPIVTTRIRGAVDHLVEGEHALFCEPRDAHGLAEALATLLRDGDLRARMSAAGRERVAIFEPDAVASEYLEALRTFVANGAGAAVRPALHQ